MNVEHPVRQPESDRRIRTRKTDSPDAIRAQVGRVVTRVDTSRKEKSTDDDHEDEVYSTAIEACAHLSSNCTDDQHRHGQLPAESTKEPVIQGRPQNSISEESVISRERVPESQVNSQNYLLEPSSTPKQAVISDSSSEKEENSLSSFHESNTKKQNNNDNEGEETIVSDKKSTEIKFCAIDKPGSPQSNVQDFRENIYCAVYTYVKEDEDEVNLTEGAPVEVIEQSDGGWWRVRTQSFNVGWAPSNYLESLARRVSEEELPLRFEIHRGDKCSIKPTRPPKTRHVKRMTKECEEENTWSYYQQKQRQYARKVSASEALDPSVELSTSTDPPNLRTDEVLCSTREENPKVLGEAESITCKFEIPDILRHSIHEKKNLHDSEEEYNSYL